MVSDASGMETIGDGVYSVTISTDPPCFFAEGAFNVTTEECSLTLPNVITPGNGDALNNSFTVDGLQAWPGSAIRIYNRWGDLLYSSENFGATAGWDPQIEEAAEGTYYYELRIRQGDDEITIKSMEGEQTYIPTGDPVLLITGSFALMR